MSKDLLSRRAVLQLLGSGVAGMALAACQPKVVEVEKVVEKEVTVVVTEEKVVKEAVEVEKEVTRVVEKEVAAKPAEAEVVLRFMSWGGVWGEAHRWGADEWAKSEPRIAIKHEPASWMDLWTKVLVQAAGGTMGDVAWQYTTPTLPFYDYQGVWLHLNDLIDADDYDMSVYWPNAVDECTIDGMIGGVPASTHGSRNCIFYNIDLLNEAGAKLPDKYGEWSWEEWETELKKVKDVTGKYGANHILGSNTDDVWYRCFKGSIADAGITDSKVTWGSEETQYGVQKALDWMYSDSYGFAPRPDEDKGELFLAGELACMIENPGHNSGMKDAVGGRFEYGASLLPKLPSGIYGSQSATNGFHAYSQTKYPEECWGLLKAVTTFDVCVKNAVSFGGLPGAVTAAWKDPRVVNAWAGFEITAHLLDEGVDPPLKPKNYRRAEFEDVYKQEMAAILLQEKEYNQQTIDELVDKLQSILDAPMAV